MPAITSEVLKAQPWKANWPPAKLSETTGHKYMVDDSGALLVDGASGGPPGGDDGFFELVCANREIEAPKTQPWKANWPPAKLSSETSGHKYMVDDSGTLLVDGASGGGPGGFSELVCAKKEVYAVDDFGALLVDGAIIDTLGDGGLGFRELVCASK